MIDKYAFVKNKNVLLIIEDEEFFYERTFSLKTKEQVSEEVRFRKKMIEKEVGKLERQGWTCVYKPNTGVIRLVENTVHLLKETTDELLDFFRKK